MAGLKNYFLFLFALFFASFSYSQDEDWNNNLIYAADKGNLDAVLNALNNGANVDARTEEGITPLMYAAQNGHLDVCRVLIFNQADINHKDIYGSSPLMCAVKLFHDDIVDTLIRNGANVNLKDNDSASCLHYAVGYGYYIISDMLLFYGADVNAQSKDGSTPLMISSLIGDTAIMKLLISKAADVNLKDEKSYTALMCAVQENKLDAIKLLIDSKAEINASNKNGFSALASAIQRNYIDAVKILISNGADVNQKIEGNLSPLKLSYGSLNNRKMISLLKKNAAKDNALPYFNRYASGMDCQFILSDFMPGIHFGILDAKYNTSINLGYAARIGGKRVLLEKTQGYFLQYWEKRTIFSLNIEKHFTLYANDFNQFGGHMGVKEIYTFGRYIASSKKPDNIFVTIPQLGFYFRNDAIIIKLFYEYADLKIPDYSKHQVSLSLSLLLDKKPITWNSNKKISWL